MNHQTEVKLSGRATSECLLRMVENLGLDLSCLTGQGYDGASAMVNERIRACSVLQRMALLADYFHCCMQSS